MSFKEFYSDLKDMKINNVCLLYGREEFLTEWASGEIVRAYSNETSKQFDVSEFDGNSVTAAEIVEACETMPLFSAKRLVLVDRYPSLEGAKAPADEDDLLDYLKSPAESTILVFTCGEKLDKRRVITKRVDKIGSNYEFGKLTESELDSWIRKRVKSHGKKISAQELKHLKRLTGYFDKESEYNLYRFDNDISKIVLRCDGDIITKEDIDALVTESINSNIFNLTEMIGDGRKKDAFRTFDHLLTQGVSEYSILGLLCRQYEELLSTKQLKDTGAGVGEITAALKSRDFLVKKNISAASKYKVEELKEILKKLYNADKLIKTGDMESRMALELIIGTI